MKAKRLNYFMSPDDEASLSGELLAVFPQLAFLDGNRWSTEMPVTRPSIDACSSLTVYLWNEVIYVLGRHAAELSRNGLKLVAAFGRNEVFEAEHV